MPRRAAVFAFLLLAAAVRAGADFGGDLAAAEALSREKGKLLLVYIWSPACHVCRWLNEKVWPDPLVQGELALWSAVKVDSDEAVRSHYKWVVDDVPQLRVIDPEGNEFRALKRENLPEAKPEKMVEALRAVRQAWD